MQHRPTLPAEALRLVTDPLAAVAAGRAARITAWAALKTARGTTLMQHRFSTCFACPRDPSPEDAA